MSNGPFRRGPFSALPERPRLPHPYFSAEAIEVEVRPEGFPAFRGHARRCGSGPPLLLVHGLMTSGYSFRYVLSSLGERFTCYAIDLPGAGRSAAPPDVRFTPAALGRVIVAFQQALGIAGCPCIANSMGGYLAMVAALDHGPGTFARLVQAHAPAIPWPRYQALTWAISLPGSRALLQALVGRDPERWVHRNVHYYDETLKSIEEAREYAAPLRTREGLGAFHRYLRDTMHAGGLRAFTRRLRERQERGEAFPVPLLLVYADVDPLVPPETGPRLQALLPGAELVRLNEASHFAHVDAPERFLAPVLRFLGEDHAQAGRMV